ncbi:MAG: hypothetical protein KDC57_17710 [Saprospiraceae bacterium]|nr:hypothetical protein [Saprospiraceae bacterium]
MYSFHLVWILVLVHLCQVFIPDSSGWLLPPSPAHLDTAGTEIINRAGDAEGYTLFLPEQLTNKSPVVLFVHGYGCLNPMIYGAWIRHLTNKGNIVIYPRYQESIFRPSPGQFANNVATGFTKAITYLDSAGINYDLNQLAYVGHSYGGTTVAYLGAYYDSLNMPQPKVVMACQPGTGPFKALALESYDAIDPRIDLIVLVGQDDKTVGDELGRRIFATAGNTNKRFIEHQASPEVGITAGHYEPEGLDPTLDNGDRNVSARRALLKARVDAVDTLYWGILDQAIQHYPDTAWWKDETAKLQFPIQLKIP